MASNELVYDVVLDTKKAVSEIKGMLDQTKSEAAKSGKEAGQAFGKSMKNAITTVVSGLSFAFLSRQIGGLMNQFLGFSNANLQLAGAVKSANSREVERNRVLNDSTASIEKKALAIGIDTADLYENTKATQTNQGAIKNLSAAIRKQENAYEDLRRSKDRDIQATEKKRDLEIDAIRRARGFSALSEEEQKQEREISDLEIQRQEARLAGDFNLAAQLQNQISIRKVEKSITDEKLKQIDAQTDKVEDLYKVQIVALRTEMEASKNKFDIDIEPAKRKLESLRETSISVGGGQVLKKGIKEQIDAAAKEAPKVLKATNFTALRDELFKKYEGIVPRESITAAMSDMVKAGLTDTKMIGDSVDRFVDIASSGKSPFIDMGSALSQLGQQFRSEQAALGETAGLTEEYISDLLPRGLALLQSEGKLRGKNVDNLTQQERALAKHVGMMDMTVDREGNFQDKLESGLLIIDKNKAKVKEMSLAISQFLGPTLLDAVARLEPLLDMIIKFVEENPKFVSDLILIAAAVAGVATGLGILIGIIGGISSVVGGAISGIAGIATIFNVAGAAAGGLAGAGATLKALFVVLTGPIGLVIGAVALLTAGLIWAYQNVEWFRDMINTAFDFVVEKVMWAKDNWQDALGMMIGFFVSLPVKLPIFVLEAVRKIVAVIREVNWGDVFKGIGDGIKGAFNAAIEWVKNINFAKLGNGFVKFIKGLLRGVAAGIPGSDAIINPLLDKLPTFATGGAFNVGGRDGTDKNLVQFMATKGERVIVQTPAQQNAEDNSQTNSGNTTIIYTSTPDSFIPTFVPE